MAFEEFTSQGKVNAEQIVDEPRSVITPQGAVTGLPGQWEVRYPDGNVRVLDDEAFQAEWGGGSDEETSPEPTAEKSLSTRQRASAVSGSDSGTSDTPTTTAGVLSEKDSSRDSDRDSDKDSDSGTTTKRRSRSKDEEDDEPPV